MVVVVVVDVQSGFNDKIEKVTILVEREILEKLVNLPLSSLGHEVYSQLILSSS